MKIRNLNFPNTLLTLVGVTHSNKADITKLKQLFNTVHYDQILVELSYQRLNYIKADLQTLKENDLNKAAWNEYYLTLFLQKEKDYKVTPIDASRAELCRLLWTSNSDAEINIRRKSNKELLKEQCYLNVRYNFLMMLSMRLQGNLLKSNPRKFEEFYDVFVTQREEIMMERILENLKKNTEIKEKKNMMVLIGNYHFDSIYDFLNPSSSS